LIFRAAGRGERLHEEFGTRDIFLKTVEAMPGDAEQVDGRIR
jgi:hypothetical protein